MAISWQHGGIFAAGALAGALVAGWAVYESADKLRAAASPKPAPQAAIRQDVPCPGAVTLSATRAEDAQFKLMDANAQHTESDVSTFIVIGKEAAASGRLRDAEIAFIMACRVAAKPEMDPVRLADAKYQLARHFGAVASTSTGAKQVDLVRRARALYDDSLRVYAARLGRDHEKTNFATDALAALEAPPAAAETVAQTSLPPPVLPVLPAQPAPRVTQAAPLPPRPAAPPSSSDTRLSGAGAAPPWLEPRTPAQPSFQCSKARSRAEKLICGDRQLAQQDRELSRLYAQARAGASNPRDFKQRSDAAWKRREQTCRDRNCLLAWYAQRRTQLLDEIDSQRGRETASARR